MTKAEYNKEWRKANPDKVRAQRAAWRKAHPDKVRIKKARYYKKHREEILKKHAAWRKENPEYPKNRAAKHRGICKECGESIYEGSKYCRMHWGVGERNHRWMGGRTIASNGYVLIKKRNHPGVSANGYVLEHRLVAERALGRYLKPTESVHHINGIKDDNRNCNLVICQDEAYHQLLHSRMRQHGAR